MTAPNTITVTGSTGHLGGAVLRLLLDQGQSPTLIVRDPLRAPSGDHEVRQADYGDFEASVKALEGCEVLFMVSGSESQDRLDQHRTFVRAAAAANVKHVVYTSFVGASPTATFTLARDHFATEEALKESGMAWTFLRDSFYLDFLPLLADQDGVIRGPAGEGLVGGVARMDVARCAATVLADPAKHAGKTYDLTGPEALTLRQAAGIISDVTGRATGYEEETVKQAYESRAKYGAPDWELDAWVSTYTAIAAGELAAVTNAVYELTGEAPLTLAEVLRRQETAG